MAEVVVRDDGENIGLRSLLCSNYPHRCNFSEWIDEPLCPRGIAYANELEQEIRRLKKLLEDLQFKLNH